MHADTTHIDNDTTDATRTDSSVSGISWIGVLGSTVAGAFGFAVGFYVGLFIILSIWGLDADAVAFPLITLATGSLVCGGAVALTVGGSGPSVTALSIAVGAGAVIAMGLVALDGSFEALIGSGLVIAFTAALSARVVEARVP